MYFQQQLNNFKKNPKKMWAVLKEAMRGVTTYDEINEIVNDNVRITDKTQMAEEINSFFSGIGKQISNSIPYSTNDPLSYINTYRMYLTLNSFHVAQTK
jgi:hypothetical protein